MIATAMFGIPALMGKTGGAGAGASGSGFGNFMKKMLGTFGTKATGYGADEIAGTEASGLAGILKNIVGAGGSLLGGSGKKRGVEGNAGLISLIMSMMAKKQFDKDVEGPLSKEDRLTEIDWKYNDITGGPQRATDRFRGLHYDPVTDTSYDVKEYDVAGNKYKNFEVDEEGIIIYAPFEQFGTIQSFFEENNVEILSSGFERMPTTTTKLSEEQQADVEKLLEKLEEDDDVQNVYHSMEM